MIFNSVISVVLSGEQDLKTTKTACNVKLYTLKAPVMSLGGLCKRNKGNLQRERGRNKASYLLNYSFVPDKNFRFVLNMHKSIKNRLLPTQELSKQLPLSLKGSSVDRESSSFNSRVKALGLKLIMQGCLGLCACQEKFH